MTVRKNMAFSLKLAGAPAHEIEELHQRLKTTTVYVTHDQVEAMAIADRIVVMNAGNIEINPDLAQFGKATI